MWDEVIGETYCNRTLSDKYIFFCSPNSMWVCECADVSVYSGVIRLYDSARMCMCVLVFERATRNQNGQRQKALEYQRSANSSSIYSSALNNENSLLISWERE